MNTLKVTGEKLEVVNLILEHLKKKFSEDVALMVCYGSAVTGPVTTLSDVDFFIVPKTEKGHLASTQFILNGIGYDLWCVDWNFLEEAASYKNSLTSLIGHGMVVYADSPSTEKRFALLKEKVESRENASELIHLVEKRLLNAQSKLIKVLNSREFDNDGYYELAEEVYYAVIYANRDYSLKGPINAREELQRYTDLPDDIRNLFDIDASFDEDAAFETAASALKALENYVEIKTKQNTPQKNISLDGFYEELKSTYNKLYRACDEGDRWRIWVSLNMIDRDIHDVLGPLSSDLPTLKGLKNLAFKVIEDRVKMHEKELVSMLVTNGVTILSFDTLSGFKKYLEERHV